MRPVYCLVAGIVLLFQTAKSQTVQVAQNFGACGTLTSTFAGYVNVVTEHSVVRPHGKILSVATGTIPNSSQHHSLFAQYHADGTPDFSFGTNGKAVVALNTKTVCKKIALLPDGKIIGVGTDSENEFSTAHKPVVFKLNANGSVDNGFGSGGQTALQFNSLSSGGFSNVTVLSDGKILAAGESIRNGIGGLHGPGVMRFNSDGTIDASFGNNIPGSPGRTVLNVGSYFSNVNMLLKDDGQIVLAYKNDLNGSGLNVRLKLVVLPVNGAIPGGGDILPATDAGQNISRALKAVKQPDGKFLFVAATNEPAPKIIVLRYNNDLTLDGSFGIGGVANLGNVDGSGGEFEATNIGLQSDGKILVAGGRSVGGSNYRPMIVRLLSSGQLDVGYNNTGSSLIASTFSNAPLVDIVAVDNKTCIVSHQADSRLTKLTTEQLAPTAGALSFDGGNDEVNLGNWFNEQDFSVEMWIKPGATQTQYVGIIDNGIWQLYRGAGPVSEFYFDFTTNVSRTRLPVELIPDVWQHVALVKGPTAASVYKNGIRVSTSAISGTLLYNNNTMWLGRGVDLWRGSWNGSMDELRFWNRPLTQAEIQNNMNCELGCTQNGLLAYYKFNQGFSSCYNPGTNTLIDASGNNRHGSLSNFALTGSTSNWVAGNVSGTCVGSTTTYYTDADGDGYGTGNGQQFCSNPGTGYSLQAGDCNDHNVAIKPGAPEVCNDLDDNCDGQIDEGVTTKYYLDADGDGYGNPDEELSIETCNQPAGYVSNNTDCDDSKSTTHPNAAEVCNGIDDDCDGQIDEGALITFYLDFDGDGFGNPDMTVQACIAPTRYVNNNLDCNDSRFNIYPGALEVCDGFDNDCDGLIDEGISKTFYRDADGDGYGIPDIELSILACTPPSGYVSNSADCNDSNPSLHPGATEICNGIDDDCNGQVDEGIILAPPTITANGPTKFCEGESVTLTASAGAGYLWSTGQTTQDITVTQTGNYTVTVTDAGACASTSLPKNVKVTAMPALFTVTGGGTLTCPGEMLPVGLSGSEIGVGYTLFINGQYDLSSVVFGTGNPISFGPQTSGTYTVAGSVIRTGDDPQCHRMMSGGVTINNSSPTTIFSITGGGCGSSIIGVDGSEIGLFYQLKLNGTTIGYAQLGTGSSINFGMQTQIGTYSVEAMTLNCGPQQMSGTALIEPNPISSFTITGGGSYCGDVGVLVGLSGSQIGVRYQLRRNGNTLTPNIEINGTGSPLDFGSQTIAGNYTIIGYTYSSTSPNHIGCVSTMEGTVNVAILPPNIYYRDADGDGYGNNAVTTQACTAPTGYVENNGDCDDAKSIVYPNAIEIICNGIDDDCDGSIDEGSATFFYIDADGDGFGNSNPILSVFACFAPPGYVNKKGDCDDTKVSVYPGATETCNGIDDDCDGQIDEGVQSTFYRDADGDGFGNNAVTTQACAAPAGYVSNNTDCSDNNAAIKPSAVEVCGNTIDENCNGQVDENCSALKIYRSKQGGFWHEIKTWESSTDGGITWIPASTTPTNMDGAITILNDHTISVLMPLIVDQVTVQTLGTLLVHSTVHIADGVGDDLIMNGQFYLENGELPGNGRLLVNGLFIWIAGTVKVSTLITANGTLNIGYTQIHNLQSTLTNNGTINWSWFDLALNDGKIINNGIFNCTFHPIIYGNATSGFENSKKGILVVDGTPTIAVAFNNLGLITGVGTLYGVAFNNTGIISPALSNGETGILTLNSGTNPLTASSELKIKIKKNGSTPASDQLRRIGNLILSGKLTVDQIGNIPSGSSFTIISLINNGVISGAFSTVNLPPDYSLQVGSNYVRVVKGAASPTARSKDAVQSVAEDQKEFINELIVSASPNPFSHKTIFTVKAPASGIVTITISDAFGGNLETISSYVEAGQEKRIEYRNKTKASGILFYQARNGKYKANGRLISID